MKKFFFFLLIVITYQKTIAQSVGIGTNSPNASAQLDVASTNKGFLIPRMTSTNRVLMSNPANGLMVYDTTQNRMYQFQNGVWRFLINNDYWVQSTTRNWVYNGTDSIGIGTAAPTQRLDVNGNIRSRDDILADNHITATGNVFGATLNASGNLSAGGNVTTNGDIIVNNSGAILQLRNGSNVNTGYFQLSGDNVRMGTNSGNSTGNLIIRMNGNDRVAFSPAGDIDIEGQIKRTTVTGNAKLLPVCMGEINGLTGAIINGTGNFTVTRTVVFGQYNYQITSSEINSTSMIFLTARNHALLDLATDGYYDTGNKMRAEFNYSVDFYFIIYSLQ